MILSDKNMKDSTKEASLRKEPRKTFADICKIGALKNFAKFTGKRLYWSLFLTLLKRDSVRTIPPERENKILI